MTGNELRQAEDDIKNEIAYYTIIRRDRDSWLYRKLCLLLVVGALLAAPAFADSVEFMCPHCEQDINLVVEMTFSDRGYLFPDTWTCGACGYENYVGINYCAMCGGKN